MQSRSGSARRLIAVLLAVELENESDNQRNSVVHTGRMRTGKDS